MEEKNPYLKKRVIIPTVTAILFTLFGIYSFIYSYHYQTTDDAYVEGTLVSIAPKVSGHVIKLNLKDNEYKNKGDLLLEIDPTDYVVALKKAEAKLAESKASLNMSEQEIAKSTSMVSETTSEIQSAKSKEDFASKDHGRYSAMYKEGISSKQEFDSSKTSLTVAKSNLSSAFDRERAAKSALLSEKAKKEAKLAEIKRLQAEIEEAKLNLSYTKIYAPQSGNVTSRSAEVGNYIEVGQPLMMIVPHEVWIVANFKETQLTYMKAGQPVKLRVDTYPGKVFNAKVDSIQRASGAKSSLFPPENAVGSYVKIVQRIPVKIVLDGDYSDYNILPGMSVVPEVKVR